MKVTRRTIGIVGMILTVFGMMVTVVIGQIPYSPIVGTATVKLLEPLSVTAAVISPTGTCTTTVFSFACTLNAFPGDSGSMSVSVFNNSNSPIIATMSSNSSLADVTIINPVPTTLAPGGSTVLLWTFNVGQSAIPDPVTMHFIVSR